MASEKLTEKALIDMRLHEAITVPNYYITRVVSGWLYVSYYYDNNNVRIFREPVFVPEKTNPILSNISEDVRKLTSSS